MAAAAVWHPLRDLSCTPISVAEDLVSYHKTQPEGVAAWAALDVTNCSITRAELAAGILANLQPGPVHIGSDNKAFIGKARAILAGRNLTAKKKWHFHKDGDLWNIFEKLAISNANGNSAIVF